MVENLYKMPKNFTECVKEGNDVRTIKPNDTYIHVCFDRKKGKSFAGEVHHNKDPQITKKGKKTKKSKIVRKNKSKKGRKQGVSKKKHTKVKRQKK